MHATYITFKHEEEEFLPPPTSKTIRVFLAKVTGWVRNAFKENVFKVLLKSKTATITRSCLPYRYKHLHLASGTTSLQYIRKVFREKRWAGRRSGRRGPLLWERNRRMTERNIASRRKYLWPEKISWHNAYSFGGPPPKISKA
jgi:hypothetical protein